VQIRKNDDVKDTHEDYVINDTDNRENLETSLRWTAKITNIRKARWSKGTTGPYHIR